MPKKRKPTARQRARVRNEKMYGCTYYGCPPPVRPARTTKSTSRYFYEMAYGADYI